MPFKTENSCGYCTRHTTDRWLCEMKRRAYFYGLAMVGISGSVVKRDGKSFEPLPGALTGALQHIKQHGSLLRFAPHRVVRLAMIKALCKRGLVVWNKRGGEAPTHNPRECIVQPVPKRSDQGTPVSGRMRTSMKTSRGGRLYRSDLLMVITELAVGAGWIAWIAWASTMASESLSA